jgi:hypothetical protein
MTIKVIGSITMSRNYEVKLDMTKAEFDALSEREQNEEISDAIDWRNWLDNSDIHDVDVDDVE